MPKRYNPSPAALERDAQALLKVLARALAYLNRGPRS